MLVKPALAALDLVGWPLLDPEQYLIADEDCLVDVSRAERELGWRPRFADDDMLLAAYAEYRKNRTPATGADILGAEVRQVGVERSKAS